jgi:hypothetical protein
MKPDALLRAVLAEINKSAVKPEPGFLRIEDWAKRWDMVRTSAKIYINKGLANGLIEKKMFRIITNGRLRLMTHYRATLKRNKIAPTKRRRK